MDRTMVLRFQENHLQIARVAMTRNHGWDSVLQLQRATLARTWHAPKVWIPELHIERTELTEHGVRLFVWDDRGQRWLHHVDIELVPAP